MTLGPIFFAAPWALLALLGLPILWLILRATPPAPRRVAFPPLRLLMGLSTSEETRSRAPWWLLVLRCLIVALLVLGFARPSLAPEASAGRSQGGPLLLVIDDGWPSAPAWSEMRAVAEAAIAEAEHNAHDVTILTTTPRKTNGAPETQDATLARGRVARLEPVGWRPDRAAAARRLSEARYGRVLWVSDGLADDGADALAAALRARGPVDFWAPPVTARAIDSVAIEAGGVAANLTRASTGASAGALAVESLDGRPLAAGDFRFQAGERRLRAEIKLPPEIAGRAARVRIVGEASAGAVRLLPAGSGRPLIGIADTGGNAGQALLSEAFYLERAVSPFATPRRGEPLTLLSNGVQMLIAPDSHPFAPEEIKGLASWVEEGGLLVRFAGPRLANAPDDLLPVRLLPNARAFGGALSWEGAQSLAPFPEDSPFQSLAVPRDVAVSAQVLPEPGAERAARVWARIEDGSPLVTAAPRGEGLIVLFHVTANPQWSTLPLSGLYVEMLRQVSALAGRDDLAQAGAGTGPWRAERVLDGFGALRQPEEPVVIPPQSFAAARAGPDAPPGLYARSGAGAAAINAAGQDALRALETPEGAAQLEGAALATRNLTGTLLAAALALGALDLLIALALSGALPHLFRRAAPAAFAVVAAFGLTDARAAGAETLELRLAYIRTGDAAIDRRTEAGLRALSAALLDRTAVEPGPPVAVDPARDDLSPFPMIYWAAPDAPRPLSGAAVAQLNRYMRLGGLLFVDTRDGGRPSLGEERTAARLLTGVDAPPLQPVGRDHVLSKAFYLLDRFPGAAPTSRLWAESEGAAASRDGVASLMVGDGDWAAAWAEPADNAGYSGAAARQRELATRFGVNLVMVALTGNYKTDQVHVPELLRRLGEEERGGRSAP